MNMGSWLASRLVLGSVGTLSLLLVLRILEFEVDTGT